MNLEELEEWAGPGPGGDIDLEGWLSADDVRKLIAIARAGKDMYDLAAGLNDDDPWFGEQRNAEERLARFLETLGQLS